MIIPKFENKVLQYQNKSLNMNLDKYLLLLDGENLPCNLFYTNVDTKFNFIKTKIASLTIPPNSWEYIRWTVYIAEINNFNGTSGSITKSLYHEILYDVTNYITLTSEIIENKYIYDVIKNVNISKYKNNWDGILKANIPYLIYFGATWGESMEYKSGSCQYLGNVGSYKMNSDADYPWLISLNQPQLHFYRKIN